MIGFLGTGLLLAAAVFAGVWQWDAMLWLMGVWLVSAMGWALLAPAPWWLLGWGGLQTMAALALVLLSPELAWAALSIGLGASSFLLWGRGLRLSRVGAVLALLSGLLWSVGAATQSLTLSPSGRWQAGLQLAAMLFPGLSHALLAACAGQRSQRRLRVQRAQIVALKRHCQTLSSDKQDLQQQLRHQEATAGKDALTGVDSFARSLDTINLLRERYARKVEAFCVVLLELDPWTGPAAKALPNSPSLDDRLQLMLSGLLMTQLRTVDHVGRYKNSTFLLVLPDTNAMHAIWVLQRIRDNMQHGQWGEARSLNAVNKHILTLTMALAEYRSGETAEQMFERAEAALEHGHANGYDQIVVAGI